MEEGEEKRQYPAAAGLYVLTDGQIEKIDRLCAEVCAVGFGVVKITIQDGLPRFVSRATSEELTPA